MWKNHDGQIVQKKPVEQNTSCGSSSSSSVGAPFVPQVEGPISPPVSTHNSDHQSDNDPAAHTAFTHSHSHSLLPDYAIATGQFDSHGNSGYWIAPETSQSQPPFFDINYDEVFQPDTASSFNMPYTTQVNYDWLFSLDSNVPSATVSHTPYVPTTPLAMYSGVQHHAPVSSSQDNFSPGVRTYGGGMTETSLTPMESLDCIPSGGSTQDSISPSSSDRTAVSLSPVPKQAHRGPSGFGEAEFERPLATLQPPNRLPYIDDYTYSQILETVKAARPLAPSGSLLDVNHPLMSQISLQTYLDLYFSRFNTAYPLIHLATFEPSQNESLLLMSMILLGATCE